MDVRLLGPLEVSVAGRALPVPGAKERTLLALLAIRANQVVSLDRIVEDLWDGAAPKRAVAAVRVYISNLRKALAPARSGEIVTQAPGYVLRLAPVRLDAHRFETLVAKAQTDLAETRPELASVRFRDALGLWRGPALADVADCAFARPEAARLEELRLAALEGRVEADLACGRHVELVGELEALVGEHPLRERLWAARMVALYRSGRQAEALRAFQQLRLVLADELGLDPSPRLVELERAVLTHDPVLDSGARQNAAAVGVRQSELPHALPLPAALTVAPSVFVGRQAELGQLRAATAEVAAGGCRVVLLGGEPGIGKTTLASQLAVASHAEGMTVAFGRCDEETLVPYQPFVQALDHYVEHCRLELLAGLGRHAVELGALLPRLRDRLPELGRPSRGETETERYRLFEATSALVATASREKPLVIVIDDLHWADKPTLLMLRHLVRSGEERSLMILAAYRDTELTRAHPLAETLADLHRERTVSTLTLRGLAEEEVAAFLTDAPAHLAPDQRRLISALWRETEGNPLFVGEILRHLREGGDLVERGGRWITTREVGSFDIPESVKEVIGRRLARLSDAANQVLSVASAVGREFDLPLLERVLDDAGDDPLDAVDEAAAARLVMEGTEPGRYAFTHPLVRQVLYDDLNLTRRIRLHRRIGEVLERSGAADVEPQAAALAHHFVRAARGGDPDKAIGYATRAAEQAMRLLAYEEAIRHYAIALEVADGAGAEDGLRCDLQLGQGAAQWRAGEFATARATFSQAAALARGLGDAARLGRAALGSAGAGARPWWVEIGSVDGPIVRLLEEALASLPCEDSALRAQLLGCLAQELSFEPGSGERRRSLSADAVAIARRLGDAWTLAYALTTRNLATFGPDSLHERLENAAEVIELAEQVGDRELALIGYGHRAVALMELGRPDEAREYLPVGAALADALGQPTYRAALLVLEAGLEQMAGRLDRAEQLAREAFQIGQSAGDPNALALLAAQLFVIRQDQGRVAELVAPTLQLAHHYPAVPAFRATLAALHASLGQLPQTREEFERVAATGFEFTNDVNWLSSMCMLAAACTRLNDVERAEVLYERLRPYAGHVALVGVCGTFGSVASFCGVLATVCGRWDEAAAHLEHAMGVNEGLGGAHLVSRTKLHKAFLHLARDAEGDRARARELLSEVVSVCEPLGLGAARRARELLPVEPKALHAVGVAPLPAKRKRRELARAAMTSRGRAAISRMVSGATDADLAARFGSTFAQRTLFTAIARSFQPSYAFGFEGSISYELRVSANGSSAERSEWWTLHVRSCKASARRGRAEDAAAVIHVTLPDFVRLVAGDLNSVAAAAEGRVRVEGDVILAARGTEMFGGSSPLELLQPS